MALPNLLELFAAEGAFGVAAFEFGVGCLQASAIGGGAEQVGCIEQSGQALKTDGAVAMLRTVFADNDGEASGHVRGADGAFGFVLVLAAGTSGAERFVAHVGWINVAGGDVGRVDFLAADEPIFAFVIGPFRALADPQN